MVCAWGTANSRLAFIGKFIHLEFTDESLQHWKQNGISTQCDDDTVSPLIFTALLVLFQMFVALLFWYQFYCGFSGSSMIDQWYLIFFNLFFSSLPQLITGVLDKDVPAEMLIAVPQLYKSGQNMEVKTSAFCNIFFPRSFQFHLETSLAPAGQVTNKKVQEATITMSWYCSS